MNTFTLRMCTAEKNYDSKGTRALIYLKRGFISLSMEAEMFL